MKNLFFPFLMLLLGCKTEEATPLIIEKTPTVLVKDVSNITNRTITLNGEVTDEGFSAATERGFVYSLNNTNPSVSDSKVSSGYGKGAYSATLDKLPVNAKINYRAFSTNSKGTSYSDTKTFNTIVVIEVKSKTGRVWMDRNLGAERAATEINDPKAIGYYFQWGRPMDGHQISNSNVTDIISDSDSPSNGSFIITQTYSPFSSTWKKTINKNLWQGEKGVNNVCPTGFRIPTSVEWENEMKTWTSLDNFGAFNSNLKLVITDFRSGKNGKLGNWKNNGIYWSSSFTEVENSDKTLYLDIDCLYFDGYKGNPLVNAFLASRGTIDGIPVRCIKD